MYALHVVTRTLSKLASVAPWRLEIYMYLVPWCELFIAWYVCVFHAINPKWNFKRHRFLDMLGYMFNSRNSSSSHASMYGVVGLVFVSWEVGGILSHRLQSFIICCRQSAKWKWRSCHWYLVVHSHKLWRWPFDKHSDVPANHVSAKSSPRQPGSREGTGASRFL